MGRDGQNHGQSIVKSSIQSYNIISDNQINDLVINITIATLAVQNDAIWQVITTDSIQHLYVC